MFNIRIIPRLDIKGPNLVKGIHLEGLRVLGKPDNFARYYYENGADELFFIDVVASLYGRNNLLEIVTKTSREIFIPLTVGGGLKTIEDINKTLRAGADKVALNTAAIHNPQFIQKASNKFGSSTIVASITAKKVSDCHYEAYTDNGREKTGINVIEWAKEAEELGAGEIYLMSIDRDGTAQGYDLDLIKSVTKNVSIPVIAAGGAGKIEHFIEVIVQGHADAISMASILHYNNINGFKRDSDYSSEGNIDFLKNKNKGFRNSSTTIRNIKSCLLNNGISCRYEGENNYDK
ncbi:MAG: imidazole glycerol phosphate synthase cyclase subunit [Candidatus Thermoplasmatota archaeon]|nr:imidazole glycerol phosphate synthase cyclase subunit [Candidatus Thermoplasmatota archaeon]